MGEKDKSSALAPADPVRAYLEAFQRQDAAALCTLVTDDFVLEVPFNTAGDNNPNDIHAWRGIEDFRKNYAEFFPTIMPRQRLEGIEIRPTVGGDVVYVEARGDMSLANGRSYKNRYIFRFDLRDGKICRLLEVCNPITAAIAFGQPLPATS